MISGAWTMSKDTGVAPCMRGVPKGKQAAKVSRDLPSVVSWIRASYFFCHSAL